MQICELRMRYERGDFIEVHAKGGVNGGRLLRATAAIIITRCMTLTGVEEDLYALSWLEVGVPSTNFVRPLILAEYVPKSFGSLCDGSA